MNLLGDFARCFEICYWILVIANLTEMAEAVGLQHSATKTQLGDRQLDPCTNDKPQHAGAGFSMQPKSPLLSIPAELRNEIYRHVLVDAGGKRMLLWDLKEPPITKACRQIQAEALPIFFAENKFSLRVPPFRSERVHEFVGLSTASWIQKAGDNAMYLHDVNRSHGQI